MTRSARGADLDEAAGRLLRLHTEAVDVGEHVAEEAARQPVARERPRRQPAVDHRGPDAAGPAFAQQVRPDLGLHHQEQPRLDQVERPAHHQGRGRRGSRTRHRRRARCAAPAAAPTSSSSRRRGAARDGARAAPAMSGRAVSSSPDRHGVDPDRRLGVDVERHRQVAEPLWQAGDVLAVAQRLIEEPRRHDHREEDDEGGVEGVHLLRVTRSFCARLNHPQQYTAAD